MAYPFRSRKSHRRDKKNLRRFPIEELECRIVFSHTGHDPEWATLPDGLEQEFPQATLGAPAVTADPSTALTFSTLANGMPILNSYPSATATMFIDFDGGVYHGSFTAEPYDIDGDPTTFNSDEQATIAEAWRQISVYFAMFNVNVTTIQPNVSTTPTAWLVVGNNVSGGSSYVNVFANSRAESRNASSHARSRISGIAHEFGHNFGNQHTSRYDNLGNKTAEYHNAFDALHGPIMGLDYTGVIHKWTTWHNAVNAARLQDDMAVIASDIARVGGGDGYKPDDYGNTIQTATALTANGNSFSRVGIIERLTDADAFSFTAAASNYNITVGRDNPSGVDVKVSIYDAAGKLIASKDGDPRAVPLTMVNDAELTIPTTAGAKYYIVVESHGNYGDQGQYIVRVDPMASGWLSADIGINQLPGYSAFDSATGTFTVAGSGHDVWGTSDGAQFLYQKLTGNGSITARVTSVTNASNWSGAGVMIRESLAADSREFAIMNTSQQGFNGTWRTATGGSTSGLSSPSATAFAPKWVRITRSGNTFQAFTSNDGVSWNLWATQTISMGSTVYMGLVSSAVDDGTRTTNFFQLNAATLTNVSTTGTLNSNVPTSLLLATPSAPTLLQTTNNSVSISWTKSGYVGDTNVDGKIDTVDFNNVINRMGGSGLGDTNGDGVINTTDLNNVINNFGLTGSLTGYAIERSTDGITFTQVATTSPNTLTFTDSNLSDGQRYTYRVRGQVGVSYSQSSQPVSGVTRAGAISNLNIISYSTSELILDWSDASRETGYQVQRFVSGNTWTTLATLAANVPMYVDSGLTAGLQYTYRILTVDVLGNSAVSDLISGTTRLNDVGNLVFTNKTSSQMAISWNAVTNATSYQVERSTDNSTWTTVVASQTTLTYTDNNVTPLGQYYYRVTAKNANSSSDGLMIFAAAPATTALPSPWLTVDTTGVGGTGAAAFNNGTFTLVGSGTDIWDTADQFRFVYTTLPANGFIQARVATIEPDDDWTWAGVMIRRDTSPGSKYAAMMISPNHGSFSQSRSSTNGSSVQTAGDVVDAPYWVRVERTLTGVGNTSSQIKTFISATGAADTWTQVGTTVTISSFGSNALIGLVVSAVDNDDLDRVTFDNISSTPTGVVAAIGGISFPTGSASSTNNSGGGGQSQAAAPQPSLAGLSKSVYNQLVDSALVTLTASRKSIGPEPSSSTSSSETLEEMIRLGRLLPLIRSRV